MPSNEHYRKYVRGKQIICLSAMLITLLGFVLDAINYSPTYSTIQWVLQIVTCGFFLLAITLYLVDKKHYVLCFGILSYGFILNVAFTTLYIYSFLYFEEFTKANILSRDIIFVIFFIVLSGFILGQKHIFIQGAILLTLILYFIFILKEIFFILNAPIYLMTTLSFSAVLYFFVGSINSLLEGLDQSILVTERVKQEEIVKNQTLVEYQHSLLQIGMDETLFGSDLSYLFRKICHTAVRDLKTNRVSIWILEENNTRLNRKHLFESVDNADPVVLERSDFPRYFQALETKPVIVATHARSHEDTSEFAEGYLKPLFIFSMLDCPIVMDGKTVGVICCEHQHAVKNWSTEDILFVQSLSVHISICYKNVLIRDLLEQVRQRNYELVDKSNEIETMNEELNALNEELTTINERLEDKVKERTSVLETQNRQLTEYAFINSHILRAPLARILGLSNLITRESNSIKDQQLVEALIHSSNELDVIIRKISDVLYDGNNLSREDIQAIINRKISNLN